MFSGLRSRWTIPRAWAHASAEAIVRTTSSATGTASGGGAGRAAARGRGGAAGGGPGGGRAAGGPAPAELQDREGAGARGAVIEERDEALLEPEGRQEPPLALEAVEVDRAAPCED